MTNILSMLRTCAINDMTKILTCNMNEIAHVSNPQECGRVEGEAFQETGGVVMEADTIDASHKLTF